MDVYALHTNFIRNHQNVTVVCDGYSKIVQSLNASNVKGDCSIVILWFAVHLNGENVYTSIAVDDAVVQIIRSAMIISEKNKQVLVVGRNVDHLFC